MTPRTDPATDYQPGDAQAQRDHREFMRCYQRRVRQLGKLGQLSVLLERIKKRVARYVETAEHRKHTEIAGAMQLICEATDDAIMLIEKKRAEDKK